MTSLSCSAFPSRPGFISIIMNSPIEYPPSSPPVAQCQSLPSSGFASPVHDCARDFASSGLLPAFEPSKPGNDDADAWAAHLKKSISKAKLAAQHRQPGDDGDDDGAYGDGNGQDILSSSPPGGPFHLHGLKKGIQFTAAAHASLYPTPAPSSSLGFNSSPTREVEEPEEEKEEQEHEQEEQEAEESPCNKSSQLQWLQPTFAPLDMAKAPFKVRSPLSSVTVIPVPKCGREVTVGRSSQTCDVALSCMNKLVSRVHVCISYKPQTNRILFMCLGWNGCTVIVPEFKTRLAAPDLENTFTHTHHDNINGIQVNSPRDRGSGQCPPVSISAREIQHLKPVETVSNGQTDYMLPKGQQIEIGYVQGITIDVRGERGLVEVSEELSNEGLNEDTADESYEEAPRTPLMKSKDNRLNIPEAPKYVQLASTAKISVMSHSPAVGKEVDPSTPLRNQPAIKNLIFGVERESKQVPSGPRATPSCSPVIADLSPVAAVAVSPTVSCVVDSNTSVPRLRKRDSSVAFLDSDREEKLSNPKLRLKLNSNSSSELTLALASKRTTQNGLQKSVSVLESSRSKEEAEESLVITEAVPEAVPEEQVTIIELESMEESVDSSEFVESLEPLESVEQDTEDDITDCTMILDSSESLTNSVINIENTTSASETCVSEETVLSTLSEPLLPESIAEQVQDDHHHHDQDLDIDTDIDIDQVTHLICNHLAFSRLSSTPLSALHKSNPSVQPMQASALQSLVQSIKCVGVIQREGKDAAGKPLEEEYYYVAENDDDEDRKMMVEQLRGGRGAAGLRNCRKTHKQYFWKRPRPAKR